VIGRPAAAGGDDALYSELLRVGESIPRIREVLGRMAPDHTMLRSVLRRPVPVRLLEYVAATPPWADDPRIQAALALNPRTPRVLGQRLVAGLHWYDQAAAAASMRLDASLRHRAEVELQQRLPELRLGDRIALARMATRPLLALLVRETDPRVVGGCLTNPRLHEADLVRAVQDARASLGLIEAAAASSRWTSSYALRLALVLQPRTPLTLALQRLPALLEKDRARVAQAPGLAPALTGLALRVAAKNSLESGG
jgi:hypothetical protein